ncbi:uncharacterized protein MAM_00090 [Metarhizium album ARSEF 1941]|uniref:Uncharacterized protein n=1 Tax=Metarhizium album (strain ARSEF 1941) TaxID=1081103 RepID=A0A0B2X407_METAS|nr:uncharacterized protein MAM_00090 [Metarhizium album ARSEF 1941]KHO01089.1 hypothetical protein MAM_00090 [Metarhizium album ARSEF 1941]
MASTIGAGSMPTLDVQSDTSRLRHRKLAPLVIAILLVSAIAWVLYQVSQSATKFRDTASERMGKKNVVFTKDGMRVGVRQVQNEKYVDKTQSWVVKAWNLGQPQPKSKEDLSKRKK